MSSTCYDLAQVREDLKEFIEGSLGYEAVLSEYASFPVDPDKTTIENSRSAVRQHADIFLLIVGGRYGTIDKETDQSITNSEYVEARARGLPIYSFVHKTVDALFPAWVENPDLKHPQIESPRVFEFVRELKDTLSWIFSFETAAEIVDILRTQWAYIFMDGLEKRHLLLESPLLQSLGLEGESLDIALRKEELWEYRLFLSLIDRELAANAALKHDVELRFATETSRHFAESSDFFIWSADRFGASRNLLKAWNPVVEKLSDAFGRPGEEGDVELIVYAASRLGSIYQSALKWALSFYEIEIPEELEKLREITSHMMDDAIESFPRMRDEFLAILDEAQSREPSGERTTHEIVWTVGIPTGVEAEYHAELDRLQRELDLE